MLKDIFETVMESPLGGDINSDACVWSSDKNIVIIHCWDGRRFKLTCQQQPDSCKYDAKTGLPVDD